MAVFETCSDQAGFHDQDELAPGRSELPQVPWRPVAARMPGPGLERQAPSLFLPWLLAAHCAARTRFQNMDPVGTCK